MTRPPRSTAPAATVLAWFVLGVLALGVLPAEVIVLESAGTAAAQHPEFAHLQAPLAAAAIGVGACVETVLVLTGALVASMNAGRLFEAGSLRLFDGLIVAVAVAAGVVLAVVPAVPGPPGLGVALVGGGLTGAAAVLVLIVLRSALRQAAPALVGAPSVPPRTPSRP